MTEHNDLDQYFEEFSSTLPGSITILIRKYQGGDETVFDELWEALHESLRESAEALIRDFPSWLNLDPSDLINTLFKRFSDWLSGKILTINNRYDFYILASQNFVWTLHEILRKELRHRGLEKKYAEVARGRRRMKLGETEQKIEGVDREDEAGVLFTRLPEAIQALDEDLRLVFFLRFFCKFTFRDIEKETQGKVSRSTAAERWAEAKAIVIKKLEEEPAAEEPD